ncbi:hypothetical protein TNIN_453621 [Trichonephila inaurata madagascariensis]|uniref:PiggyBac transposable element-derived protein domain-containing protein n=1 Tax=Trichonephila inaurata madagascariensis TaxID=2747483 RepID=A0A8X6I654_9ARAC|nr:hypothetical protein TNIN_453621 [Trichonephila inaurata madagascariensis]
MILMCHGRNSLKQFIRGKRFGYKLWTLCGREGYISSVYCSKTPDANNDTPLGFVDLLKSFGEQSFRATGTLRKKRINRECPLKESMSMRKKETGTPDFPFDENSDIFLVRWNENNHCYHKFQHFKTIL